MRRNEHPRHHAPNERQQDDGFEAVVDAGTAAAWYQDRVFQSLSSKRLQIDEISGFVGAKQKNASPEAKAAGTAGDAWLWLAIDADTKLVPCWHVGDCDGGAAMEFIDDLASRLTNRVQIRRSAEPSIMRYVRSSMGRLRTVPRAATALPNAEALSRPPISGAPDHKHISTSCTERNNLNIRMHSRRMTRLTNAFQRRWKTTRTRWLCTSSITILCVSIRRSRQRRPWLRVTDRFWEVSDMIADLEVWEATA